MALFRRVKGSGKIHPGRPAGTRRAASTWVARQVPGDGEKEVKVGARLELKARKEVTVGHRVLVASHDRSSWVGLAVVLGEPTKHKGKQYIRTALVTHSFGKRGRRLRRKLGETQGARQADRGELRNAGKEADRRTGFSFVFKAATQVAGQLSDGATSERDSEKLLIAMIKAGGYQHVDHQLPMPGSRDPSDGEKEPKPLRADVVANVGSASEPELLVIEGEWTQTGAAESAAQAYEYSRRIMDSGKLANNRLLFDLDPGTVKKARVHALVVANKLLDRCVTAEKLDVDLMDYFAFADLIRARDFSTRLRALG